MGCALALSTERGREQKPRPEQPGLHQRNADMKPAGSFLCAELLKIAEDENVPIFWGKGRNGIAHGLPGFHSLQGFVG